MIIEPCAVNEILDSTELIAEYAAECSIPAIGEINPHRELYALMEKSGLMQCFMARDEQNIGFAIVLMPVMPHYGKRIATLESIFIAADKRTGGAGRKLMDAIEAHTASEGCVGILYSAPAGGRLERLLESSKQYHRTNAVFYRRLS